MNNTSIHIICNSPECLSILSSGQFPFLNDKDLFTCNSAYTFFKTRGRHLNFFTDPESIIRNKYMPETLTHKYEKKIEFIYSQYGVAMRSNNMLFQGIRISPVKETGSSALNALAYLAECENYKTIHLIGYTFNEVENNIWNVINQKYDLHISGAHLFTFKRNHNV